MNIRVNMFLENIAMDNVLSMTEVQHISLNPHLIIDFFFK